MSKQIKLSEIKSCLGMDGWSNNQFANALCCMMIDVIESDKSKAKEYANEGNEEMSQVYYDCAENMQERKKILHDMLDSLGHFDDIRK